MEPIDAKFLRMEQLERDNKKLIEWIKSFERQSGEDVFIYLELEVKYDQEN